MKKLLALTLIFALLLSATGCAGVNLNFSGTSPFRNIRDDNIQSLVEKALGEYSGQNISVGVMRDRETCFRSIGDGMNEHTVLPVGKLATMFVGLLVANFEDNGWLGRDEVMADWINSPAGVPVGGEETTVWQALSGISNWGEAKRDEKGYFTSGMMFSQGFEEPAVMLSSTEKSSLTYAFLCECLRQSYNMNADFVNLISNQVVVKMDLQDSSFFRRDILASYDGFESSCYDLMKVVGYCGSMLEYDDSLSRTVEIARKDPESYMTLAFDIYQSDGQTVYFKSASAEGGSAYIAFIPELGVGVSVISDGDIELDALGQRLLDIVKG